MIVTDADGRVSGVAPVFSRSPPAREIGRRSLPRDIECAGAKRPAAADRAWQPTRALSFRPRVGSRPDGYPVNGDRADSAARPHEADHACRRPRLVIPATLVLAAALLLPTLGANDYWLDELHALLDSAGNRAAYEALPNGRILDHPPRLTDLSRSCSVAQVWHDMRADTHPPVYFLLLHAWRRLVGDGEWAVRLPSAVLAVLTLLPLSAVLRSRDGVWFGAGAAFVLALSSAHIQMGQQARPYAFSGFLAAASFWLLLRMEAGWRQWKSTRRLAWATGYGLTASVALLTHYFAGLALLAHLPYALIRFRGSLLWAWLAAAVGALAAFAIIWGPALYVQTDFIAAQEWLRETGPDHLRRTLIRAADLPLRLLFILPIHNWNGAAVWYRAGGGLLIAALALLAAWRRRGLVVCVLWYGVPVATLAALDLLTGRQTLSHVRYASVALPGLAGLLALGVGSLRRPAPLLALGVFVTGAALTLHLPATQNPEARLAAGALHAQMRPGDLLVFDAIDWPPAWARGEFVVVTYYLPRPWPPVLLLETPPGPTTVAALERYERVFVVSPRVGVVPNHSPQTHRAAGRSPYIPGVGWIYLFDREPESG